MPEDEFLLLLLIKKNHNKDLLCYLYPVLGISSIDSNLKRDRNGKGGGAAKLGTFVVMRCMVICMGMVVEFLCCCHEKKIRKFVLTLCHSSD